jgi:hypothetical protein
LQFNRPAPIFDETQELRIAALARPRETNMDEEVVIFGKDL